MKISAIVITKNEEKMIRNCLKSISFADEIIVVDTGNTDKTNSIAKKSGARIVKYAGIGSFADWRNNGLKSAVGDWIIYLDADERVTKELKDELLDKLPDTKFNAYAVARRNFIFGKEFHHSGNTLIIKREFLERKILLNGQEMFMKSQALKESLVIWKIHYYTTKR